MSLRVSEDVIISALKESKRLERKNKFQEALDAIEKVASDANNFTLESSIEITEQIANLCNKLVTETESPVLCLRRAEQVLTD